VSLQAADFPPLGGARAPPGPSGVWTSGAGKAREPAGGVHRDNAAGATTGIVGGAEAVERTPSKGIMFVPGHKTSRVASAPPPSEDSFVQDVTDGLGALALGKEQS
jgi:hypothetical protein